MDDLDRKNDDREREVAIILHYYLCRKEHVEQCGWYYDSWFDYLNGGHVSKDTIQYIEHARRVLEEYPEFRDMTLDNLIKLFSTLHDTNPVRWERMDNRQECFREICVADEQVERWKSQNNA